MTSFAFVECDPRYMIDSDGNVYGPKAGVLKPFKGVKGKYLQVATGGRKHLLHRLLAETFIPNPEGKRYVAHNDGNGLNDSLDNLRWATQSENMADTKIHGTAPTGTRHWNACFTQADVMHIRAHKGAYRGVQRDLAHMYGVVESVIHNVMHGVTYPSA
ncbi:HNH endonuclease [Mycobacterium phage ILeeKay]|uniref:tail protein n=1 Tax=Mycobacterium phage Alvin TaxID=1567466 RepID=UPI000588E30E|nr:tail protein [Mycobacterium phage Alvin]APQ41831.1 HNH homing endonuclease [Mycobacterium phage Petruchio]ATN89387.1 HNH endonuclease [Mycobacterium phage ILeeKay]AVO25468.1 HNH endonuclease [Mycobacterium phage Kykar]URQ04574.1 HNH endonuclease [Mycobacterium phage Seanderson]USH44405.1 HNH endonuclease [Mycobacterium phage IgnatiusPatJac]